MGALDGKVALVTGGGSGIGEGIVRCFADAGATVVVNDVTIDAAKRVASDLGSPAHPVAADVSDRNQVDAMYEEIDDRFGGLDVLVNNAGVAESAPGEIDRVGEMAEKVMAETMSGGPRTTHWDMLSTITDESWHRMISIHLSGTFFNMRAAIPRMIERDGGAIVNISSEAARVGTPGTPHYSAAKAGILGLTRSVAAEVASRGVRVNAICPGVIDTPASQKGSPALVAMLCASAPLGRVGEPSEIATAALFLASDASSYMTGQSLGVNGGVHM
jgi:3-oxoacyl-[acyl-carrier protein] reductase